MRGKLAFGFGFGALCVLSGAWGCGSDFVPFSEATATGTGGGGGAACRDADLDGQTDCDGDCDDSDPTTYGGATELCGDGVDNDCDGTPDQICMGLGTYVSVNGDDMNPGTQQQPVRNIKQGIANAITIGNGVDVYVAEGHYSEDVALVEGISILGGYEDKNWTRDPKAFDSAILCVSFSCVTADDTITRVTEVDGFRIMGLGGQTPDVVPGSVAVKAVGGTPTIRNNRIFGGDVTGGSGGFNTQNSVGMYIAGPSNTPNGPLVEGNEIQGGQSPQGSIGMIIETPWIGMPQPSNVVAEVLRNKVRGGQGNNSVGINAWSTALGTLIEGNDIQAGAATNNNGGGWGMQCEGELEITGNRINADATSSPTCTSTSGWCGGIVSYSSDAVITNNIVYGVLSDRSTAIRLAEAEGPAGLVVVNSNYLNGGGKGGGVGNLSQSTALILDSPYPGSVNAFVGFVRNNILVGGKNATRFGLYEETQQGQTCSPVAFTNNVFYFEPQAGAVDNLYREWNGSQGTNINTLAGLDPTFINNLSGDPMVDSAFHLMAGSPCIDAGTFEDAPTVDFEGDARPMGSSFDIGPDER